MSEEATKTNRKRLAPNFQPEDRTWVLGDRVNSEDDSDSGDCDSDHGKGKKDEPTKLPEELLKTLIKPAGQLLLFGMVSWDMVGRSENKSGQKIVPNLYAPHRFTDLKVRLAVSGCVSAHSVLITEEGKAMTFGRNEYGQLGIDNTTTMEKPTLVTTLQEMNIIGAATGKNHTLFLTDTGTVYACGDNKTGQCGIGKSKPTILTPKRINYRGPPIVKVGCGSDFSTILDVKGRLYTFGRHTYEYRAVCFKTITKVDYDKSPVKISVYYERNILEYFTAMRDVQIVDFSCGQCHTVAVDSKKKVYSWGYGGYGRLGHVNPLNELIPCAIKYFNSQARSVRSVHCGSTYSLAVTHLDALYFFGKIKRTGEANMCPTPVEDLAGKIIHHVGTGFKSIVIVADDSVISWGALPTYGELGLGEFKLSSTTPKEVTCLSGIKVLGLSMGMFHTMIIAQNDTPEQQQKLETFKVYEP